MWDRGKLLLVTDVLLNEYPPLPFVRCGVLKFIREKNSAEIPDRNSEWEPIHFC